jgi:hypothetical protein
MLDYKMEYDDVGGARSSSASSKVLQHRPHYSMYLAMDDLDMPPPPDEGRFIALCVLRVCMCVRARILLLLHVISALP